MTARATLATIGLAVALCSSAGCTWHHSKVPIADTLTGDISPNSVFVSEDDSGLALLGIFVVSEPDHYAVLLERMRRRYKCATLHHVQLDFYSDFWLFVGFPIARVTAICDPGTSEPSEPPDEQEPSPVDSPAPSSEPVGDDLDTSEPFKKPD